MSILDDFNIAYRQEQYHLTMVKSWLEQAILDQDPSDD